MECHLGIVTPTFKRHRFLRAVLAQLHRQTHRHWSFVLVNDGPDPRTRRLFEQHSQGDPRFHYLETERHANDWGATPRVAGMHTLAALPHPPTHIALWDDDDEIYPHALQTIAAELTRHGAPDLLIIPVHAMNHQLPPKDFTVPDAKGGQLLTDNLVVRLEVALEHYAHIISGVPERGEDFAFFDRLRQQPGMHIAVSQAQPIGRYDGLRKLQNLRRKLGIPAFNIAEQSWYQPLRRRLRG